MARVFAFIVGVLWSWSKVTVQVLLEPRNYHRLQN